jgi:hypothetical protein
MVEERKGEIRRCSGLQFVVARVAGSAIMHAIVLALILRVVKELGGMIPEYFRHGNSSWLGCDCRWLWLLVAYTLTLRVEE